MVWLAPTATAGASTEAVADTLLCVPLTPPATGPAFGGVTGGVGVEPPVVGAMVPLSLPVDIEPQPLTAGSASIPSRSNRWVSSMFPHPAPSVGESTSRTGDEREGLGRYSGGCYRGVNCVTPGSALRL